MSRLPLNILPTFRVVARLGNLRAAAQELHLTHSAVSQQVKLLEEQLGFELFDRRGRRIVLNAAGAALLRHVEPALDRLDEGLRAAVATAKGEAQRIRLSLLPSFAQRWLLPRMPRWRERYPEIHLELHTSQQLVDLVREGYHVALRQGQGPWRGLQAEQLVDSPLVVLGSAAAARRLKGCCVADLAEEPLLGRPELWERWFALGGWRGEVSPVATFNDAGLLLQAVEQDIGIGLAREVLAADALRDGRLLRLSPTALPGDSAYALYWCVFPPELDNWPPLVAFRAWLQEELALSLQGLGDMVAPSDPPS
ncbi:LysR substrate-binding domain-containing protein [Rhodoferax fermentans]|uniref:LysR family transcriptional regulator n=1 Tax=Rhodoferax fermentans TaxID=28066 RepID=A0A1T1API1_RHOFE|nr:LysR substrate-binding domain-containing protein [Rhodoferax fermentans]MBK1684974.1 LysR family transcriptional regulator [Rhodoferax fermentans]OOV05903.1 LysR family transcriptional regulator [Rhodoferax fermentans]